MFSLLDEAWLPVRRSSGLARIRPCEVTDNIKDDPVLSLAWGRADFDAASREFMIGLLASSCPPADSDSWRDWWREPPAPSTLAKIFEPYARAFMLDGDGPRFMQDQALLEGEALPISQLLIEAPGGNTELLNKDLFKKRGGAPFLSRAAAAMALYTLQSYAPSGGQGHRTSMRGGGPLTTLVLPAETLPQPPSLWHQLWLNVVAPDEDEPLPAPCDSSVFPWLGPTRTSEGNRATTPDDVHPAQVYWGMPRRIRIDFTENETRESCPLGGTCDPVVAVSFRAKNFGTKYESFEHPLTSYYKPKKDAAEWLPTHPQPGGIGYRHWVALAKSEGETTRPAKAVRWARDRLIDLADDPASGRRARLLAHGFDMDNMKARGFVESEMPLHLLSRSQGLFDDLCRQLVSAAGEVAGLLVGSLRIALFSERSIVKTDRELFASLRERFYLETERDFFDLIGDVAAGLSSGSEFERLSVQATKRWLERLRPVAIRLFEEAAPLDADATKDMPRLIDARRSLHLALHGYGKRGATVFQALHLPVPDSKPASKRRKKAA